MKSHRHPPQLHEVAGIEGARKIGHQLRAVDARAGAGSQIGELDRAVLDLHQGVATRNRRFEDLHVGHLVAAQNQHGAIEIEDLTALGGVPDEARHHGQYSC